MNGRVAIGLGVRIGAAIFDAPAEVRAAVMAQGLTTVAHKRPRSKLRRVPRGSTGVRLEVRGERQAHWRAQRKPPITAVRKRMAGLSTELFVPDFVANRQRGQSQMR